MKYAAIDINFDSLNYAYGFPRGYKDPSFFGIAERFMDIADRYNFKYSIYVIGKDLKSARNCERVKEWSSRGHEIGNHSWSHVMNLSSMDKKSIYNEVKMAHDKIAKTIGSEPKGFISPFWSTSPRLIGVLEQLSYLYDTSYFPSWVMFPMVIKNLYNHLGSDRLLSIMSNQNNFLSYLFGKRNLHSITTKSAKKGKPSGITILPIPTNKYRIACWHTPVFTTGWKLHEKLLKSCLKDIEAFYYLIHPADLLDKKDLDKTKKLFFERVNVPLNTKINYLEKSIETILDSGRRIVTMRELAEKCRNGTD